MEMYLVVRQHPNYDGCNDVDILSLHASREEAEAAAARATAAQPYSSPSTVKPMTVEAHTVETETKMRRTSIPLIVTRHQGAVAWLEAQGITGEVISHVASADEVRGRVVIGALPLHLASEAEKIGSIDMPGLRPDQRGQDLTPVDMDAAGATLRWYAVRQSN